MSDNLDPAQNQENQIEESNAAPAIAPIESLHEIPESKDLTLNHPTILFLKETAKWTKFIAIVGFVMVGFIAIAGLLVGSIMTAVTSMMPSEFSSGTPNPAAFSSVFSVIYILMAGLYFFPIYYLYNFSSKLKAAIELNSPLKLEESFKNLKSHYKFIGIILIITLILYGGMFVIIGGIGLMAGSMF